MSTAIVGAIDPDASETDGRCVGNHFLFICRQTDRASSVAGLREVEHSRRSGCRRDQAARRWKNRLDTMRAFFKTKDLLERDEIAAKQAWLLLQQHLPRRDEAAAQ